MSAAYPAAIGADPTLVYDLDLFINLGTKGWSESYYVYLQDSDNPFGDLRWLASKLGGARKSFLSNECFIFVTRAQQGGNLPPIQLSQIWTDGLSGCGPGRLDSPANLTQMGWRVIFSDPSRSIRSNRIFHGMLKIDENWKIRGGYQPRPTFGGGLYGLFTLLKKQIQTPSGGLAQFCMKSLDWTPLFLPLQPVLEVNRAGPPWVLQFTVATPLMKGPAGALKPVLVNDEVNLNQTNRGSRGGIKGPHRITSIGDVSDGVQYTTATCMNCPLTWCLNFVGYASPVQYAYYAFDSYQPTEIAKQTVRTRWLLLSFAPANVEQMTAHPCGLAVETARIGYQARMKFPGVAGDVPVTWYTVPDNTQVLPTPIAFGSRSYSDPHGWNGIGEQYDYDCCGTDYRPAYAGPPPAPYLPGPGCGSVDAFAGQIAPIFTTNGIGQAECCGETPYVTPTGGEVEGGFVTYAFAPHLPTAGGEKEGGFVTYAFAPGVPTAGGEKEGGSNPVHATWHVYTTGGEVEGGYIPVDFTEGFPTAGGEEEGGFVAYTFVTSISTSGGEAEGGFVAYVFAPHLPTAGGEKEGGSILVAATSTVPTAGGEKEGGSILVAATSTVPTAGGEKEGGSILGCPFPYLVPASSLPINTGLLAGWPVYEGSGTTLHDISRNALDATLIGAQTWAGSGQGAALSQNNATGQYTSIPNGACVLGANPRSFFCYIKTTATQFVVLDYGNLASAQRVLYYSGIVPGKMTFEINGANNTGSVTVNDGNWHFVGFTYDGSTTQCYVDGLPDFTLPDTLNTTLGTQPPGIAGSSADPAYCLVGEWRDARMWTRALAPSEVLCDYLSGGYVWCNPCESWPCPYAAGGESEGGHIPVFASNAVVPTAGGQEEGGDGGASSPPGNVASHSTVTTAGGEKEGGNVPGGVHVAPVIRGTVVTVSFQTGTWTIAKPTGVVSGDVLLTWIVQSGVATAITPPAGWSLIQSISLGAVDSLQLWTKTAGGSEPASYSWTAAVGAANGAVLCAWEGSAIVDQSNNNHGTGTTATALSVTPTVAPYELLAAFAADALVGFSTPSGMAAFGSAGSGAAGVAVFSQAISAGGASGNKTSTLTSADWGTIMCDVTN